MEENKKTLTQGQAETVTGGSHYSNTEIKDHVGETVRFTCYESGKEAFVKILKVDFKENWLLNKCVVYVMPVDDKSRDVMFEFSRDYAPEVVHKPYDNYYLSFRINYNAWQNTNLEKI